MNPYAARLTNESGVETFSGVVDFPDPTNQPGYGALLLPRTFTETADGVTYTAQWTLPPGARLLDLLMETFAAWTAATAPLNVSDPDGDGGLLTNFDLRTTRFFTAYAGSYSAWGNANGDGAPFTGTGSGKLYPAGALITAVVSPTTPGGPTGLSRVTLLAQLEAPAVAAVVV